MFIAEVPLDLSFNSAVELQGKQSWPDEEYIRLLNLLTRATKVPVKFMVVGSFDSRKTGVHGGTMVKDIPHNPDRLCISWDGQYPSG